MQLSETWQYSIAVAQIISSGAVLAGLVVAGITIVYNIKTSKKSQTSVFFAESRHDIKYLEGQHTLSHIHNSGKSFRSYIFPQGPDLTDEEKADRIKIQYCLNFYERLAVSVKNGSYHEQMIKEVFYSSIVKNFEYSEPFIKALREKQGRNSYYQEFEWLAKKWKKSPLRGL
ncbi:DUF4760 domain-containing protein [Erwinia sp. Leaf53]|uniref:DUF4760 domain-containing protein n=1 Tax=Erwinia sp. Leaf53 TaxID=1736225 RepID=UPI0006F48537|nr:DUF4760 domain-containing protein [Erwinia sp. Leaf53]KQN63621.1 hypothetical protein ASF13_18765 [Erwinia sp. Leaf53]